MEAGAAKRYVLDFFAELVQGNAACWDRVADDATWKLMARGRNYPYPTDFTKASYRKLVEESAATFPDGLRFTVLDAIAEDDKVAVLQLSQFNIHGLAPQFRQAGVDLRRGHFRQQRGLHAEAFAQIGIHIPRQTAKADITGLAQFVVTMFGHVQTLPTYFSTTHVPTPYYITGEPY